LHVRAYFLHEAGCANWGVPDALDELDARIGWCAISFGWPNPFAYDCPEKCTKQTRTGCDDVAGRLDPRQVEVMDEAMAEVLRKKQPQDRLRIGFKLWISVHGMLTTHIRHSHPDWDEKAVEREVARRLLHGSL
jgi:hypothetical protein